MRFVDMKGFIHESFLDMGPASDTRSQYLREALV